jgi:hypothetical protein
MSDHNDELYFFKERGHGITKLKKIAALYDEDDMTTCFHEESPIIIAAPAEEFDREYPILLAKKAITKKSWDKLLRHYRNNRP